MQPRIGGTFAPPLSDELLNRYADAISALPACPVKDALASLMPCCKTWWDLPEPEGTLKRAHPSGVGTIVPLTDEHAKALDPHIPWGHELDSIQALFDLIPLTDKAVRDMAFHLLWHVRELDLGREPLTADKL